MEQTTYRQLRQVESTLNSLWRSLDAQDLSSPARRSQDAVRRYLRAAQALSRDYELSESEEDTRAQLRLLPKLIKAVEQARAAILKASEYDLVGAVDVAQLTAQLDMLADKLR